MPVGNCYRKIFWWFWFLLFSFCEHLSELLLQRKILRSKFRLKLICSSSFDSCYPNGCRIILFWVNLFPVLGSESYWKEKFSLPVACSSSLLYVRIYQAKRLWKNRPLNFVAFQVISLVNRFSRMLWNSSVWRFPPSPEKIHQHPGDPALVKNARVHPWFWCGITRIFLLRSQTARGQTGLARPFTVRKCLMLVFRWTRVCRLNKLLKNANHVHR